MIRRCLLLANCLLIFSIGLTGQTLKDFLGLSRYEGVVVLLNGDTVRGKITFNNEPVNYHKVIIRDSLNNKRMVFGPTEVKFFSLGEAYFYPKFLENDWILMYLMLNDSLKVWEYRNTLSTPSATMIFSSYILEKPDGKYLKVNDNGFYAFRKKVSEFFRDYPQLSSDISSRSYKVDDLMTIARKYNEWLRRKER